MPWPSSVISFYGYVIPNVRNCSIVENLLVTHNPIAEGEINKRSPAHHVKGCGVELRTVHRRLLIPVSNTDLLNKVDVEEGKEGNWEQYR